MSKSNSPPHAADSANPPWSDEDFAMARKASEVHSRVFSAKRTKSLLSPRAYSAICETKAHAGNTEHPKS